MKRVVPYVGTWIEIAMLSFWKTARGVVPYVGTWIEIGLKGEQGPQGPGRSLRGNVDRNIVGELNEALGTGRSLRGNVDRNLPIAVFFGFGHMSFPTWERG